MKQQPILLLSPHDGDILNRHDGEEKDDTFTITVTGIAQEQVPVVLNDVPMDRKGTTFSGPLTLRPGRNRILARAGDAEQVFTLYWRRNSRKQYRFSVDDNILFLKDLGMAPERYASLFDHWFLRFWRDMHQEYGTKVHFNIYYQTDDFDLTQMPDKWKDEWQANADWIHLSFHALQDKPDRPYRNAGYSQVAHDFDLVCGHIRRFAGNEVLSATTTIHWAECPREGILALRDRGIENVIGLFDVQGYSGPRTTGYYLSEEQCSHCDTRGAWQDPETGMTFIRCTSVVNALEVSEIPAFLEKRCATPQTAETVELLIHEQYFREDLPQYYQPTVQEKVRTALEWVQKRGYEPVFWSDVYPAKGRS